MTTTRTELALVLRLFQHDLAHQRKRMLLTMLAIGWGTLSIVILLSFGEGMKRAFAKGSRGMGEGIAVVWPGATTKPYKGPAGRPQHRLHGGGRGAPARARPGDRPDQPRVTRAGAA